MAAAAVMHRYNLMQLQGTNSGVISEHEHPVRFPVPIEATVGNGNAFRPWQDLATTARIGEIHQPMDLNVALACNADLKGGKRCHFEFAISSSSLRCLIT